METSRCFEYLITKTQKLPTLNEAERQIILTDLKYFLSQSLTDQDRRNHLAILQNRWKAFEFKVIRTPLLKEPKTFFHPIQEFLGKPRVIFEDDKEIKKYDQWELRDFFEDLLFELNQKESFLSKEEQFTVFCGLKYLLSESKLSNMKQDRQGIQKVWKGMKPTLEKYGFFYKYQGAASLSSRLRLFITGCL